MLNKLISLFERLVVAQEAQAEAAKMMAGAVSAVQQHLPGIDVPLTGETPVPLPDRAPTPAPATPVREPNDEPQAPAPATDSEWNPFIEKIMARYTKEKQDVMDTLLTQYDIDASAMRTGAEKHGALLDWAKKKSAESEPPTDAPAQDAAPAQTATAQMPEGQAAELRTKCHNMAAQLNQDGQSVADIKAAIGAVNGGKKLGDTPDDKLSAVLDALLDMSKTAQAAEAAADDEAW